MPKFSYEIEVAKSFISWYVEAKQVRNAKTQSLMNNKMINLH